MTKGMLPSNRLRKFARIFAPSSNLGVATFAGAFLLLALFLGCKPPMLGPGIDDFSADLLDSYTLNRTSAHQVYIAWQGCVDDSLPRIPTKVLECAVHAPFILGKRQGLMRRSNYGPNDAYEIPDPNVLDYWILDTRKPGNAFGPMNFEDFVAKRKSLDIPESVTLRDVYTYRR